jgi:hypothetical protein
LSLNNIEISVEDTSSNNKKQLSVKYNGPADDDSIDYNKQTFYLFANDDKDGILPGDPVQLSFTLVDSNPTSITIENHSDDYCPVDTSDTYTTTPLTTTGYNSVGTQTDTIDNIIYSFVIKNNAGETVFDNHSEDNPITNTNIIPNQNTGEITFDHVQNKDIFYIYAYGKSNEFNLDTNNDYTSGPLFKLTGIGTESINVLGLNGNIGTVK